MHLHFYDDIPPKFVGELFENCCISIYDIGRIINENFVSCTSSLRQSENATLAPQNDNGDSVTFLPKKELAGQAPIWVLLSHITSGECLKF
jgi:hypothetical protein